MNNGNEDDLDLGLTLGNLYSCIRTRVNNNSGGAGVNAGPSVDMTFAASDPLSELVWSPHKGLSLKCADCSKADKKPFLLWNVGPSNIVPSQSQSIRFQETSEEKIVDGNLILSNVRLDVDSDIARRDAQITENGDILEGRNTEEDKIVDDDDKKEVCGSQIAQMVDTTDGIQTNTGQSNQDLLVEGNGDSGHDIAVHRSPCNKLNKEFSTNCDDATNEAPVAGVTTASDVHTEMESRAHIDPLLKLPCQVEILGTKGETMNMYSSMLPCSGKLECTAENDFLDDQATKEACWQSEKRLPRGSSVPLGNSPINSNRKRAKSRALSDGNFNGRYPNGEEASNESVESCNSAGLFSKGKRQLEYDRNFVVDSKRLKRIDASPTSVSAVRNASSFMTWISNMVKGFSKSSEDEDPSPLPRDLARLNPKCPSSLRETMICSEHQDSLSRNTGFQTMFRSLYSHNTKVIEAGVFRDDCSLQVSRGLVQADKTNTKNSLISCPGQNGLPRENFLSNDKTNEGVHSCLPYKVSTTNPVQGDTTAELAKNKASAIPQCNGDSDENENPGLASEGRPVNAMSNKRNMFGSLWINRFTPKVASGTLNLDPSKRISSCEAIQYPDYKGVISQTQENQDFAMKQKCSEAQDSPNQSSGDFLVNELQLVAASTGCSVGFKEVHAHNQTLNKSESMASLFARRLDALKHIIPIGSETGATCVTETCFYCGKFGHSLRDCSEVTETELNRLLRNISSYAGAECQCLCVKCFQLDHWAAACPRGASSKQQNVETNTSIAVGSLKLFSIDERTSQSLEKEDDSRAAAYNRDIRDPIINGDSSGQRSTSSIETQKGLTNSSSRENNSGEVHNLHLSNLVSTHAIHIPEGIFDAVRRLQVSRTDILKSMESHALMPYLEGFFLRLRLGKWEAGLGGTGYYVACITGQSGKASKDSRKSIYINVGGIKCHVGSQYVSNQVFLEDEFTAWWCRALRNGEKLPTKEDLEFKLKQRINLGF